MELDEMKDRWAAYDRKLDASLRLNARLLRQSSLDRTDSALGRLSRLIVLELLVNLGVVVVLGAFLASHFREWRFLVPAAVLDACAILLAAAGAHQLVSLHGVDYGAPVVAIQRQLEGLKIQRIRITKWVLLLAPLLWTPLLIVGLQGLLGIDVYSILPGRWLAANVLFGLALIPPVLWASKRYADRLEHSPFVQGLLRDIAGRNLTTATEFLATLSRFEQESDPA